jgi:uncharacterized repeat protein (TIGR01451 family)
MAKKNILLLIVALTSVCACIGQGLLPEEVIEMGADLTIGFVDPSTGDVPIQYTLYLTNIGDQTLDTVILKDFIPPSDVVMKEGYFEIKNLAPGQTKQVTFDVVVLGWGLDPEPQYWDVDFTIRVESGDVYAEQDTFYYRIELYTE